ncbi:MAG: 4-alpha-glucanotransferase [Brachybacterium sp.]|nr:4-alpha-glucanotransferase [Brachybacterium sp.]
MASETSPLRDLARDLGVATDYWGWDGTHKDVTDDTLRQVLLALGHELDGTDDDGAARHIREERHAAEWRRTLPPVVVVRRGHDASIPVHVDHGTDVEIQLVLEDGSVRYPGQVEDSTPPAEVDGRLRGRARFAVPQDLPLGWHRVVTRTTEGEASCDLVVTPDRVSVAEERLGARRAMGVQAQMYSVRSDQSWGIGDLGDMRDLAAILGARHGADFLLVNPLHASDPAPPMEPSPYLPVTRRFTAALYVRIEDIPEYARLPEHARQRIDLRHRDLADWNRRTDRLERDEVLGAKLAALEELYAQPRTAGRQALLDAYRATEGAGLEDFALWCALAEISETLGDEERRGLVSPEAPMVERARRELADRIDFHCWVQWVLNEQLGRAQAAAEDAGMRIGIMHDLAVGVTQEGADAWRLGHVLASGIGVGAPADQYNQQGQNWDQPPWRPDALAEAGYRPWRDMLRSLMRHAGALRIDHVLGLFRLWWIPAGNSAADGAYVHYDHEAMIGILALEAERSRTIVIGEDLGTFEPWVREYLSGRGILGTSILWFENDDQGRPLDPSAYRRLCLASVNTHDLPPTAGYLAGDHVDLRHDLGLLERPLEEEQREDAAARERFLAVLREEGLLAEDSSVEETIVALHRHLARTPSLLLGVSLVDMVGERRIQNQPGTDEEYANWRVPLADAEENPVMIDDLARDARSARLLAAVREALTGG